MKLNIEQLGKEGEERARLFLNKLGYILTQPDWIGIEKGKNNFVQFEIKMKGEPFKPPPFWGHGLNIYQIQRRQQLQQLHCLPCKLIIFEKDTLKVYVQWLNKLEEGKYFDTRNKIRIYPLENFEEYLFNYNDGKGGVRHTMADGKGWTQEQMANEQFNPNKLKFSK